LTGHRDGLELPDQPGPQQRQWLTTLSSAHGIEYDRAFANILRGAHGKVFALVAQVRANTRNSLVRDLADDANTTVLDHIRVLEATGYVDFDALAEDAATASPPPLTDSPAPPGPVTVVAGPGGPVLGLPAPTGRRTTQPGLHLLSARPCRFGRTATPGKRNVTYPQRLRPT
jgi:hypothetical protein